jgi:hypothetical protein
MQSSGWASVLRPKTSKTLFGPVNFSVYLRTTVYKIKFKDLIRTSKFKFSFRELLYDLTLSNVVNQMYDHFYCKICPDSKKSTTIYTNWQIYKYNVYSTVSIHVQYISCQKWVTFSNYQYKFHVCSKHVFKTSW